MLPLKKESINWNVVTENCFTASGIQLPKIAIVREDTKAILGVHGEGYAPYQNSELKELLYSIGKSTGLEVVNEGYFKDGEKVFMQLKGNDLKLNYGDTIENFITGVNSFDGSTSLGFGNSTITISCQNTFFMAFRQLENKIKHTASLKPRIDLILRSLDIIIEEEKEMFKTIERMTEVKMDAKVKELVTRKLFELAKEDKLDGSNISTRKQNQLLTFEECFSNETKVKGDTLFGLFSAATNYTTHFFKKEDASEQKMFAKIGNIERDIFKTLAEMVA